MSPSAASLSIFRHLFASVAEEMGVTLGRTGYSPNIKERLDFSCAVFLAHESGAAMLAQAAHQPVHLGAMPASVASAVAACSPFHPGDVVILNDPYEGGNHLPDITLVSPVFTDDASEPHFFVASRAHHADVGGMSPGSMPLSTELFQEGIIIPPLKLIEGGERNSAVWQLILRNVRTPDEREGDLAAQLAAHATGTARLNAIVARYGLADTLAHADALIAYAERLTRAAIERMPDGVYHFVDYLDDDGQGNQRLPIAVTLTVAGDALTVDFTGSAEALRGNLNAVPAIVISAVGYCIRCVALALLETDLPMNQGAFAPIGVVIPPGSLLDPQPPHAVAAGNVETSQRIVDVVFGALAQALPDLIPAASQGTMNNLTFGGKTHSGRPFAYYETMGGGVGAGPSAEGGSGLHSHMSNTLNTPVEALEFSFPLRVKRYALRHGSGGNGQQRGGDGLVRELQFLVAVQATLTSERRTGAPYGLQGGEAGNSGENWLISAETPDDPTPLPAKTSLTLAPGDTLRIATPGGGGWGHTPE